MMSNHSVLAYCRPGYESDTANELTTRYGEAGCFGYPVSKKTKVSFTTICTMLPS